MTVSELIVALKDLNPQSEVWLATSCGPDIGSALLHRVWVHSVSDASIHEPGVVMLLDYREN